MLMTVFDYAMVRRAGVLTGAGLAIVQGQGANEAAEQLRGQTKLRAFL